MYFFYIIYVLPVAGVARGYLAGPDAQPQPILEQARVYGHRFALLILSLKPRSSLIIEIESGLIGRNGDSGHSTVTSSRV